MSCYPDNNAMIAQAIRNYDNFRARGGRLFLLKRAGQTEKFSVILELTSGYFVNWDKYREQTQFLYATLDVDFVNVQAQASYIAYGVPDSNGEIDVYELKANVRDRVPPDSSSPSWKLFATRRDELRFTLPEDEGDTLWQIDLMTIYNGETPVFDGDNFVGRAGKYGIFGTRLDGINNSCLRFTVPTIPEGKSVNIVIYSPAYGGIISKTLFAEHSGNVYSIVRDSDIQLSIWFEDTSEPIDAEQLATTIYYAALGPVDFDDYLLPPSEVCS